MAPASVAGYPFGTVPLHSMAPGMEFSGAAGLKAKSNAVAATAVASRVVPSELRSQVKTAIVASFIVFAPLFSMLMLRGNLVNTSFTHSRSWKWSKHY